MTSCYQQIVDFQESVHSPPQKRIKQTPTLALKPRGDVTRNPKQGYQWPQKGHVNVSAKKKHTKKQTKSFSISHFICSFTETTVFTVRVPSRVKKPCWYTRKWCTGTFAANIAINYSSDKSICLGISTRNMSRSSQTSYVNNASE